MLTIRNASSRLESSTVTVSSAQIAKSWVMTSGVIVALWMWNWELAIALTLAGMSGTALYLGCDRRLHLRWLDIGKLRQSRTWKHHQSLWLGLSAGVGVFLAAYGMLEVLQDTHAPWLVAAAVCQVIGIWGILGFLAWNRVQSQQSDAASSTAHHRSFDDYLADLTHAHPVARLVAVRTLTQRVIGPDAHSEHSHTHPLSSSPYWTVAELLSCLKLMRQTESEQTVQQTIGAAIQRLEALEKDKQVMLPDAASHQSVPIRAIPNLIRTRKMVKEQELMKV